MAARYQPWAQRAILALAGLLAGLLAAEGFARLLQPPGYAHLVANSPDAEPDGLHGLDKRLGLVLTPGFQGDFVVPGLSIPLRVNSLGMRGAEPSAEPSSPRALVLGDSFTMAEQVREEDSFVHLLGSRLGGEAFNGGIAGDCTWQSAMRYRRWQRQLDPDRVLLIFFAGNDLTDNATFDRARIDGVLEGPIPVLAPREAPPWPLGLLRAHSFLYSQVAVVLRKRDLAQDESLRVANWARELSIYSTEGTALLQELLPASGEALSWLDELTRAQGQRLTVAMAPPLFAVDRGRVDATFELMGLDPATAALDQPQQAVLDLLRELSIDSCDLTPALRAAESDGADTYLHFDGHWSPEGHAVVAETLHACLTET